MKAQKRRPFDFTASADGAAPAPAPVEMADSEGGSPPATVKQTYTPAPTSFGSHPAPVKERAAWWLWLAAFAVSVLWAVAPIAYAVGYRREIAPLNYDPFAILVFALLAVGPVALVWIAAWVIRQGMKLSEEVRRTRELAQRMLAPAALASAEAGSAVQAVRVQIDHAAAAATEAREVMLALREVLSEETQRLAEAAAGSARTAAELARTLGTERDEMNQLAGKLDAQSVSVTDAITRQARMVAEAADLAETQLREAESVLSARAADLAAAAGEASDAGRVASEDLARQVARLETAGAGVTEQMRVVEEGLSQQRAALVSIVHALRADQEDFAAQAESRAAQLSEFVAQARMSAAEVGDVSAQGAEALSQLIGSSVGQMGDLTEAVRREWESLSAGAADTMARLAESAAQERQGVEQELRASIETLSAAAEEARKATQAHADAARQRVDQLNEAAFEAHQKADTIFEARLNDARDLIEQSAMMVEQAGAKTAQRLEEGVQAARDTLAELERLMAEVDSRAEQLPAESQRRAEEVKAAVEQGMDELLTTARKAAEETQAIDAAFQDRVRRNYDMLSEAVRVMGVVSGAPTTAPPLRPLRPEPRTAEEAGLRPRLRLTPTASDEEFRNVFETAGGKAAEPAEDLSWTDILSSMDGDDADAEALTERMVHEISAMGIDPAALLPKARIDEIAAAVQTKDVEGAREVVKRLAPAAIRRLVRRLFSDVQMRGQAERFLKRFNGMLEEAAGQDREGFLTRALLSSDGGRAWLLLDAAAGDLA